MTFFALAPLARPRWLAQVSFHSGLLVSEQPFYPFYLLMALTALAGFEGSLGTAAGLVALGVTVAVSIGLAILAVTSTRAASIVTAALDSGLDDGWRIRAGEQRRLPLGRILLAPFYTGRRDVRLVRNIRYGDAGRFNLLDVYVHRSQPTGGKVFIFFHGGGFSSGRKSFESRVLLRRLAGAGWVCISANYRLGRSAQFPDHLVDAKKVVAWARENAGAYGADPSSIVVGGSSAGAHIAAMCALTPGRPEFQPGFEDVDTSIAAAVCLYGWYGKVSGHATRSSPRDFVPPAAGTRAPPFFVAHGENDTLVPVSKAREFVSRLLNEADATVVYAELPRAQHAFDLFHSLRSDSVVGGIESFLAAVLTAVRRHS